MQQDGETGSGTALRKPVLAALAAVGLLVLLSSLGAGTTLAPNWANFTSGDLSEIGSLDGGGSSIAVNDNLDLSDNALTSVDWSNSDDGSGSNLDADLWDGFEHENTLDGRNVFGTFTGSGEEYVKLGRVKSNNERFTVELIGGRDRGHKSTRHVRVFGWKRFSDEGGTYMESGENSPDQSQNFDVETSDVLIVS